MTAALPFPIASAFSDYFESRPVVFFSCRLITSGSDVFELLSLRRFGGVIGAGLPDRGAAGPGRLALGRIGAAGRLGEAGLLTACGELVPLPGLAGASAAFDRGSGRAAAVGFAGATLGPADCALRSVFLSK